MVRMRRRACLKRQRYRLTLSTGPVALQVRQGASEYVVTLRLRASPELPAPFINISTPYNCALQGSVREEVLLQVVSQLQSESSGIGGAEHIREIGAGS